MKIPQDIIFIINPNSGRRNSTSIINELIRIDENVQYFVSHSKSAFDEFIEANIHKYRMAIICGGDGTLNHFLKFTSLKKELVLGMFPNGSGDGFAKELGFGKDIKNLLQQIEKGNTVSVDLVKINNGYSCNVIGLGIDSKAAYAFERSISRGFRSYIYHTIKSFLDYTPIEAEIELNGSTITGEYYMINVANTRQFGNNAFIAPHAKCDDGKLDLVLVKPFPFYYIPVFITNLFSGKLKQSKYIEYHQSSRFTIKSNSETYQIDGEAKKMEGALEIAIADKINILGTKILS